MKLGRCGVKCERTSLGRSRAEIFLLWWKRCSVRKSGQEDGGESSAGFFSFFFISPPPPLAGSQSAGKPRPLWLFFPVGRLTRASRNAARIDALDVSFFTLCHAYATKERHLEFPSGFSDCGQPIGCQPTAEGARVFSKNEK